MLLAKKKNLLILKVSYAISNLVYGSFIALNICLCFVCQVIPTHLSQSISDLPPNVFHHHFCTMTICSLHSEIPVFFYFSLSYLIRCFLQEESQLNIFGIVKWNSKHGFINLWLSDYLYKFPNEHFLLNVDTWNCIDYF